MKCVFAWVMCLPLALFAQNDNSNGFTITGTINGLPENSVVYLAGISETDTIAAATVKQNSFMLKGKLAATDGAMLFFTALQKRIFLFVGNEAVNIKASDASLADITITGSPTQTDYESFMNDIKPLNDFVTYYRAQVQSAPSQAARDSASIMLNTAYNIYQTAIDRFMGRRKNSPVAALLLAYSYDMDASKDIALLENRFNTLGETALQSRYAQGIKQALAKAKVGSIGSPATEFTQQDTVGKNVSLSQFKGKYVLIDFWASWCRPCRMENPNVVAAYNQFKNKNFTIIGVSLDQEKENWLKAIKADKLAWTHVSDLQFWGNAVAKLYGVESIPQNFLIDPNGTIIAKNLRGAELAARLKALLP